MVDPCDTRSSDERERDEEFERLFAGPMGIPRLSEHRRSVSLLSSNASEDGDHSDGNVPPQYSLN